MTKQSQPTLPPLATPGDEPVTGSPPPSDTSAAAAQAEKVRRKTPNRGIRKRVLGEGEGDYCIYEIASNESGLPKGTLIPIPAVPRFVDTKRAMDWIRNKSGDLLAGKQVMIFRACEIMHLRIQTQPQVVIETKQKITVTAPEGSVHS